MGTADHAPDQGKDVGVIHRQADYRQKGHAHVGGSGRAAVYNVVPRIQAVLRQRGTRPRQRGVAPASPEHAAAYTFSGRADNFLKGNLPYSNQAHHMLPCEAFSKLTAKQRRLMRKVAYNVNDGPNIIFLPAGVRDGAFHDLPYHQGSHPKYTKMVTDDFKDIRNSLQREIDKDKNHEKWSPPGDILGRLEALETKYWTYLTTCGSGIAVNLLQRPAEPESGMLTA